MTTLRPIRDVMLGMPELRRFAERMAAPDFPTPAEVAAARRELAHARGDRQAELPLAEHAR